MPQDPKSIRIALGQANPTVGDLEGNCRKALDFVKTAQEKKADVLVLPELFLSGYPPEDLLHRPRFLQDCRSAMERLCPQISQITLIVGWPQTESNRLYNAAAVIRDGKILKNYRKGCLPNYGVFDEKRYFHSGQEPVVVQVGSVRVALTICEDIWELPWLDDFFLKIRGEFDAVLCLAASPFHMGKIEERRNVISRCAVHFGCPLFYCNLIGGQDELIFDGRSMVVDAQGKTLFQAAGFQEDVLVFDCFKNEDGTLKITSPFAASFEQTPAEPMEEVWQALVLGTKDYVRKNSFSKVLIGLSGGVDSALTAAIAAEALGPENVIGISMPSRFNAAETRSDAQTVAANLGIGFHTLPIEEILSAFSRTLSAVEGWNEAGLAYENLQARIRGTLLMTLSNQFGYLVLTTGNKSETAVGYSTLYGDTAGGFAVIKDVPKTMVYQLCDYYNRIKGKKVIPQSVIDRIPTAELRPNQKDRDSLPDYPVLDQILKGFIEEKLSRDELIARGLPRPEVERVLQMVDRNEYKRRQSPPGIKITPRAFGKDRRMPITNRYRG
ncbi:MAG TPA: NAD+ synthase [Anaerohalosphaeraceae bacterium]|nr:NAD+ synthase [Anaerohalosphaeraceae bacterium]